jgi:1,4-alpha-glucan branching enzyme
MLRLLKESRVLDAAQAWLRHLHNEDKVLAFERGSLIFVFNFHPTRSFEHYGIEVPAGEYVLRMDTEEPRFGGFGHLAPQQHYLTRPISGNAGDRHQALVYLPSRTALILQRANAAGSNPV